MFGFLVFIDKTQAHAQTTSTAALIAQIEQQLAALTQQLVQYLSQHQTCYTFNSNLGFNQSGTMDVVELHIFLLKQGISYAPDDIVTYNQGTSNAVTTFQEKYASEILWPSGLKRGTGYFGTATRNKADKLAGCNGTNPITNPTSNCTANYQQKCSGNYLFWYDSCGNQGNLANTCPNGCSNGACLSSPTINPNCTQNYQRECYNGNSYNYDSCGNQGTLIQTCSNGCSNGTCTASTTSTNTNNCLAACPPAVNGIYYSVDCSGTSSPCSSGQICQLTHTNASVYNPTTGLVTVTSNLTGSQCTTPAQVLTTIQVTPSTATLQAGNSQYLTAQGFDQSNNADYVSSFTWQSTNQTVATVNSYGNVTALSPGTANITATSGNVTGSSAITVTAAPTSPTNSCQASCYGTQYAIDCTGTSSTYCSAGTVCQLIINTTYPVVNGVPTPLQTITGSQCVSSSNPNPNPNPVACTESNWTHTFSPTTCPASGQQIETSTQTGTCTGGVTYPATQTINCTYQAPAITAIAISPAAFTLGFSGGAMFDASKQLAAVDQNNNPITSGLTWNSTNTSIAVVDNTGLVSPRGVGTATITATSGSVTSNNSIATVNASGGYIPPPTVDIKANNSDGPITVASGASTSLSWTSTNASSCTASIFAPGAWPVGNSGSTINWSGSRPTSGYQATSLIGPFSVKYILTCTSSSGVTVSDSVTVNASGTVSTTPTISLFTVNGNSTDFGMPVPLPMSGISFSLAWNSANATSCAASGDWSGNLAVPGGSQLLNTYSTATVPVSNAILNGKDLVLFTITCSNDAGQTATSNISVVLTGSQVITFGGDLTIDNKIHTLYVGRNQNATWPVSIELDEATSGQIAVSATGNSTQGYSYTTNYLTPGAMYYWVAKRMQGGGYPPLRQTIVVGQGGSVQAHY